ncbi:hypothetical protein CJD36_001360 [Flavipsychrobacter stenotrophus]|uniref:Uncharacterized protein n=1 Tax=Flavipsychrobacter stenotrophus TaxID=2077091 RepID=A0A2S7T0Z2_9BACT|nr:hypothetical protein CJD36_001360 [Flavipsychrobacter stenotrophus]
MKGGIDAEKKQKKAALLRIAPRAKGAKLRVIAAGPTRPLLASSANASFAKIRYSYVLSR